MRVFVLGAGASRHAGYPLAGEVGSRLSAWVNTDFSGQQYRACLEQILDVYGDLDNFEFVLADLMTFSPGSRAAALGVKRPYVLADLKEAIRDYFDTIRFTPAPLYDQLASLLRPGDSVITFNYDLGVERALRTAGLWDIKTGYGFSIEDAERSPVEVLKLHGSTNWRALVFGGMAGFGIGIQNSLGYRPALFFRPDLDYLGYQDFVDPLCTRLDRAASLPAMIMPALPKHFHFTTTFGDEWKDFWDGLWHRAVHAIENADELVIIGYSLPTVDERARAMLLGTPNKTVRLSICCGDTTASLEREFRDRGFNGIQSIASTFEGFLSIQPKRPTIAARNIAQPHASEKESGMETIINAPQNILLASAWLRDDGIAIYSVEGTPLQQRELTIDQLRIQLERNGAFRDNIDKFVNDLLTVKCAEIRQHKLITQFFVG